MSAVGPAMGQTPPVGEWRHYGADGANTKYSPLDLITLTNFSDLEVAWRWTSISTEVGNAREAINPGLFKATPLMVGGLVYLSTPLAQVAALDAGTGEPVWMSPHGDGPRNHPALKALILPALGGHSGANAGGPLVTKTLLMVNSGARDVTDQAEGARSITAYHKDNGEYLGSVTLPAVPRGNPMTCLHDGKQYIVVAVGGGGGAAQAELIALVLP